MKIQRRRFYLASILILLTISMLFSATLIGAFSLFGSSLERVNKEGAVKVSAIYLKPEKLPGKGIAFNLSFNTHSVDLDVYDIKKVTFIQIDKKDPQPAISWVPSGSGHHLGGVISFAQEVPSGNHELLLIIKEIDGVQERIFKWQFPLNN